MNDVVITYLTLCVCTHVTNIYVTCTQGRGRHLLKNLMVWDSLGGSLEALFLLLLI